jgi:hypothetical protein
MVFVLLVSSLVFRGFIAAPHDKAHPVPTPAQPTKGPKPCRAFIVPWEDFAAFREKIA